MTLEILSSLTAIDIVILLVLAVGLFTGIYKGVIRQAFALGGLIAGLVLGTLFCKPVSVFILDSFRMSEKTASVIAFVAILLIVPIGCMIVGGLLSKLVKVARLGFFDRLAGGAFGLLKYFIFMGLFIQLMEYTGLSDKCIKKDGEHKSVLYEPVRKVSDVCLHWTWEKVMSCSEDVDRMLKDRD